MLFLISLRLHWTFTWNFCSCWGRTSWKGSELVRKQSEVKNKYFKTFMTSYRTCFPSYKSKFIIVSDTYTYTYISLAPSLSLPPSLPPSLSLCLSLSLSVSLSVSVSVSLSPSLSLWYYGCGWKQLYTR